MKILKFYAEWCGPCKQLAKNLDKVKESHPDLKVESIDVDGNDELVEKYGIRNLPVLIKVGEDDIEVSRHVGLLTVSDLEKFIFG